TGSRRNSRQKMEDGPRSSPPYYGPTEPRPEKAPKDGLKKKLKAKNGRWPEELPSILWSYRTTPRKSTKRTPFSLAFGMEAEIPTEVRIPTLRTKLVETGENDQRIQEELTMAEAGRIQAAL
ncbi:hypothetical protein, partial [Acidaminobacter sp. JC074]|uniref:hypothetical protein n=1 Tax=Acidaminobacter sp. JC074 TaxID=2530199 RepID=UPI001F100346